MESSSYRYNTVREYSATLKSLSEQYHLKIKKYNRRITAIDITVYSVSGVLATTGVILSSVIMVAPIVVLIVLSAITTIAGVITAITKRISLCSQKKLREYSSKYTMAANAYSQLLTMISNALDDEIITDEEFSAITAVYNSAMSKLETENNLHNNNNVRVSTASTNSNKYNSGTNKYDINNINKPRI